MNLFTARQSLAGTVASIAAVAAVIVNTTWEMNLNDDIARALPSIAGLAALASPDVASPPPVQVARSEDVAGNRAAPNSRRESVTRSLRGHPALPFMAALPAPAVPDAMAPPQFSTAQFDYVAARRLAHQQAWVQTLHQRIALAEEEAERNHWQERDLARLNYMLAKAERAEAREAILLRRAGYRQG